MPAHRRSPAVLVSAGSDLTSRTGFAANLLPGSRSNKKTWAAEPGIGQQHQVGTTLSRGKGGSAFPKNQGSSIRGDVACHFMTSAAAALSG
jgi:hypothetical protein